MNFAAPGFLWLLLLVPPILIAGLLAERHALRVRRAFAGPATALYRLRLACRLLAMSLALASLVVALAGPRVWKLVEARRALVLAVGIDVSKSMLAEDVAGTTEPSASSPASRLEAARQLAVRLFEELDGGKAGLFFFARNGIEVVPPTRDQGFLRYMASHTSLAELTESGSDLAAALETGEEMIDPAREGVAGAIVLFSDGEDTENSLAELVRRADLLKTRQLPVYAVGVGRPQEALLPIRRPGLSGIQGFYADSRGDYLKSRLEERNLREIASAAGGGYWQLDEAPPEQLISALRARLADSAKTVAGSAEERRQRDLSPIFLGLGMIFLLGFLLL